MNYFPVVLRGKHRFLQQHNYLLLGDDLYSLTTGPEREEKGLFKLYVSCKHQKAVCS
jgi:hypothetical protein